MSTAYPGASDSFPTAADLADDTLATKPHSTLHGNLGASVKAIQDELGANPSGSYSTVAARLGALSFDVKAYGAVGDGIADDTTPLNGALAAAAAVGGVVTFPSGTYLITSTLTWPRNVRLDGRMGFVPNSSHFYPTIKWAGAAGGTMLTMAITGSTTPGPHASHLRFDANGSSNPASKIVDCPERMDWDFGFSHCSFRDCNGNGITLQAGAVNFHMHNFRYDNGAGYAVLSNGEGGQFSFNEFTLDTGSGGNARGLISWVPSSAAHQIQIGVSNAKFEINGTLAGDKAMISLALSNVGDPIQQAWVTLSNVWTQIVAGETAAVLVKQVTSPAQSTFSVVGNNISFSQSTGGNTALIVSGATVNGPPAGHSYPLMIFAPFRGEIGGATNSPQYWQRIWLGGNLVNSDIIATSATGNANRGITLVDATGGTKTITLPTAVGIDGETFTVKKQDSSGNTVTIATSSSQTIDGASTKVLSTQYASATVVSDGTNWALI